MLLQASLSAVLEPWQMEAFEGLGAGAGRDLEVLAAKSRARMAGMKLNEEQMAAFKEMELIVAAGLYPCALRNTVSLLPDLSLNVSNG